MMFRLTSLLSLLLIFPAVLIVIAGPAVIQWIKIIGAS